MGFKTVLCLTGADHSDQDVTTAAGLCAEIGAYLSVLIMPPPTHLMSHRRIEDGVPEWPIGRGQAITRLNDRFRQIDRFTHDVVRREKRSRDVQKLLESMSLAGSGSV